MPFGRVSPAVLSFAMMVVCQFAALGQSRLGPTTYADRLSPEQAAKVEMKFINSPPTPPPGFVRPLAPKQGAFEADTSKSLAVPTSKWTYGCTATAAGMMFAYYDRNGYPAMYAGPCNGGVCPLTNLGQGVGTSISGSCSIIATQNGFDGRTTPGHVNNYWIDYDQPGPDPWVGRRPEHVWEGCTADFMGTNQWKWDYDANGETDYVVDGGTTLFVNDSAEKLYDYVPSASAGLPQTEACHGMRLFAESRGYRVLENYTQQIDTKYPGGFSYADYVAEIDAGRPVMIQVMGHSMVGVGYNVAATGVYLNDTWDNAVHVMTWGGDYSGMGHFAVTVLKLAPPDATPPTGTVVIDNNHSFTNSRSVTLSLSWDDGPDGSGVARMRFSDDGMTWTAWEPLQGLRAHTLPSGDGCKTVRVQYLDRAGNRSAVCRDYILVDTTPPAGGILINGGAATATGPEVSLNLNWADDGVGVRRMRFSDDGATWTPWEPLQGVRAHTLPAGLGCRTVRVQYTDAAFNYSPAYNDYIRVVAP